jgi:hypothetical protein
LAFGHEMRGGIFVCFRSVRFGFGFVAFVFGFAFFIFNDGHDDDDPPCQGLAFEDGAGFFTPS